MKKYISFLTSFSLQSLVSVNSTRLTLHHKNVLIFIVLSLLTACLEEHPKGLLTEEEAYGSKTSLYNNAISTLYNYITTYFWFMPEDFRIK